MFVDIGAASLFVAHLIFVRCAPHTLRVRRIFRTLIFGVLTVMVCCGVLLLFRCAVTTTKPAPWTIQDIEILPWRLGIGLFLVLGGGVFIHHLVKNPVRETSLSREEGKSVDGPIVLHA